MSQLDVTNPKLWDEVLRLDHVDEQQAAGAGALPLSFNELVAALDPVAYGYNNCDTTLTAAPEDSDSCDSVGPYESSDEATPLASPAASSRGAVEGTPSEPLAWGDGTPSGNDRSGDGAVPVSPSSAGTAPTEETPSEASSVARPAADSTSEAPSAAPTATDSGKRTRKMRRTRLLAYVAKYHTVDGQGLVCLRGASDQPPEGLPIECDAQKCRFVSCMAYLLTRGSRPARAYLHDWMCAAALQCGGVVAVPAFQALVCHGPVQDEVLSIWFKACRSVRGASAALNVNAVLAAHRLAPYHKFVVKALRLVALEGILYQSEGEMRDLQRMDARLVWLRGKVGVLVFLGVDAGETRFE